MALPLGKLTILVGAGLIGAALANEGRMPGPYDLLSGAYRIFVNPLKQENSTKLRSKPKYDSIMQQVDMLREEITLSKANPAITIVTGSRSGSGKYGIIVIVVIVGSGYVWWKGWRLPDMMFATRRSLSDARESIAKQLENVFSSITDTKRFLSSRITRADRKTEGIMEDSLATRGEVSASQDDVNQFSEKVKEVHRSLRSLESRMNRIGGKQDMFFSGMEYMVRAAKGVQSGKLVPSIKESARPALECSNKSPSRSTSMPVSTSSEPSSPTTNGFLKKQASCSSASSSQSTVSRWKQFPGTSNGLGVASITGPQVSNVTHASEDTNSGSNFTTGAHPSVLERTSSSFTFLTKAFGAPGSDK